MKSMDFSVGNLHKSVDFTEDFKDFMDLMKNEDLLINLRIYTWIKKIILLKHWF